ncbi:hypothetical protein CYMTET_15643 [Cymbomonas tetramitiformis]|uniref:Uncharacterized protein n=1 Tax=Cymbomonas tetramitiformis TaxID=36881 RepID=A0AAE0L8Q5_9CHLO|nr:hypothetical protein CYMTET_15643 [Cymbomonas tetramitiformis]
MSSHRNSSCFPGSQVRLKKAPGRRSQIRAGDGTESTKDSLNSLDKLLNQEQSVTKAEPTQEEDAPVQRPEGDPATPALEGFGGKRVAKDQLDEFFDIGMRFEGFFALIKALQGGMGDLDNTRVGQTVIVASDIEALLLWEYQAYEVKSIYYQKVDDELGATRFAVECFSAAPPEAEGWEQWCELYSEAYHSFSGPVKCRRSQLKLRSVGGELKESLQIALPILGFWISVSYAFVKTASE